jgi:DNA-directed RNA polymerase subunit RPC12/RpoP
MFADLRQKARDALARARELLAAGDEPSVRHACLELRFCIEYVTYDHLVAYLAEVPDDTVKKWTPKQVIDALRDVDPNADQTVAIAVGLEDEPGVPAKDMQWLGEDRRFSVRWANANHNALGNFLHAPTLEQIESGKVASLSTMLKKATEVVDTLTAILDSTVFRVNFGQFYQLDCPECGKTIKRRAGTFTENGIVCRTSGCGATFDVIAASGQQVHFRMHLSRYRCPTCKTSNTVGKHQVQPGVTVECPTCYSRATIELALVPEKDPAMVKPAPAE